MSLLVYRARTWGPDGVVGGARQAEAWRAVRAR